MFAVTHDPIDLAALTQAVGQPAAGAVATFLGTTRETNAGRRVIRLEYEAYPEMAEREMQTIAEHCRKELGALDVAIAHRVGVVPIGEASVGIAAAAAHRAEAFDACRYAIDRLKEVVPIWKKEVFEGGVEWIGHQQGAPALPEVGSS